MDQKAAPSVSASLRASDLGPTAGENAEAVAPAGAVGEEAGAFSGATGLASAVLRKAIRLCKDDRTDEGIEALRSTNLSAADQSVIADELIDDQALRGLETTRSMIGLRFVSL